MVDVDGSSASDELDESNTEAEVDCFGGEKVKGSVGRVEGRERDRGEGDGVAEVGEVRVEGRVEDVG